MIRSLRVDVDIPGSIRADLVKSALAETLEDGGWKATIYLADEPQPSETTDPDSVRRR